MACCRSLVSCMCDRYLGVCVGQLLCPIPHPSPITHHSSLLTPHPITSPCFFSSPYYTLHLLVTPHPLTQYFYTLTFVTLLLHPHPSPLPPPSPHPLQKKLEQIKSQRQKDAKELVAMKHVKDKAVSEMAELAQAEP